MAAEREERERKRGRTSGRERERGGWGAPIYFKLLRYFFTECKVNNIGVH